MKAYLFYQLIEGLSPTLYGFTSDKVRAKMFHAYRPKLQEVIKDVSKKEYNEMKDILHSKEIIPHEFETCRDHFGKMKVSQLATEYEIMTIILHKEDLVLRELSKYALPLQIFEPELQKCLEKLHMDAAYCYTEEVAIYPGDTTMKFDTNFRVDELGLFLHLFANTM